MRIFLISLCCFISISTQTIQAQKVHQSWTFKSRTQERDLKLTQGQNVRVYWQGIGHEQVSKGRLSDISEDSFYLESKDRRIALGNQNITEIRIKKSDILAILVGACLLFAGLFVTVISSLFFLYRHVFGVEGNGALPWIALGLGLSALAFYMFSGETVKTKYPFSDRWELQRSPAPKTDMP